MYKYKTDMSLKSIMIQPNNLKFCHKCKITYISLEQLKKHSEQDHVDLHDMLDVSLIEDIYQE